VPRGSKQSIQTKEKERRKPRYRAAPCVFRNSGFKH
jgi:hypothetical protein